MIDAFAVGELEDLLLPLGVFGVVDNMRSTQ
jgi:hypothetical protein